MSILDAIMRRAFSSSIVQIAVHASTMVKLTFPNLEISVSVCELIFNNGKVDKLTKAQLSGPLANWLRQYGQNLFSNVSN
ncbi:hypothetical protein T01_12380 [Trichinella spiralis]|uniref:Uncharacterized protein n=1 Tax=Trichinella spiralis TaxID=6334 RepID=A0A0V1BKL8_TRISP|nr:hypothetical protein T01_12380 [Trichinella spiralis]